MHLRVTVEEWEPWVWVNETSDGKVAIEGPMADVLEFLAKSVNFTYTLIVPKDHQWGIRLPNGSWTGMIGMMVRNEADFGLGPFAVNYDRNTAVDTTIPIFIDYNTILVNYRKDGPSIFSYLMAFGWEVWLGLILSLLTISFIACFFDFVMSNNLKTTRWINSFPKYVWKFYGNLLYQGSSHEQILHHQRVLQTFWWLTVIVIMQSFSGHLMAILVMKADVQINNLKDLEKSGILPGVEKGSSLHSMFM
ncbi:glutamate receptor ionotropic, delta-2-like, partial [Limulus polyphemus]|uniref:Glutamate receptor ionotropic, delta-2-like n=1 Tax=Limulus polyphemus TaxID=6850 RepID=A0ABM1RXV1_LIMPO